MNIWNLILHSNTFNFVILVVILSLVVKKIDINRVLDGMRTSIIERLENSKKEKEEADVELKKANKIVENLEEEIKEQYAIAEKNIQAVIQQTQDLTQKSVEQIYKNADATIENEEKQISTLILKNAANTAIDRAKTKIENLLKDHPELQDKYIDESISEIDKVKL